MSDVIDYLTRFIKANPQILQALYGADPDTAQLQAQVEQPEMWTVQVSRKATRDDCWPRDNYFGVFDAGKIPNQYGEPTNYIPYKAGTQIHYCVFNDEMSDLGFLIMQFKDGTMRVGIHVDTWE
jgi:hypothetical protein